MSHQSRRAAGKVFMVVMGISLTCGGCGLPLGSQTVTPARFHYNQAIHQSLQEQMLLNLVRLRHDEPPFFLSVDNVVTQYTFDARLGASGSAGEAGTYSVGGSASAGYTESPTIAYRPLEDAAFAERLLSPLSPNLLVLLSHSGWQVGELMRLMAQKVNGLSNLPVSQSDHLQTLDRYQQFFQVTSLFAQLDDAGTILHRTDESKKEGGAAYILYFQEPHSDDQAQAIQEAKALLGLDPDRTGYRLIESAGELAGDSIAMETRSLLGVMTYLSHGVDRASGALADELDRDFKVLEHNTFHVHRSAQRPRQAYLSVEHGGNWYSIHEDDRSTKRSFTLLLYLFSVQAATQSAQGSLLLTLPAR